MFAGCDNFNPFLGDNKNLNGCRAGWEFHDYQKHEFGFCLPEDLINQNVRGIDSSVESFENSEISVGFDYGYYNGLRENSPGCVIGNHIGSTSIKATPMLVHGVTGCFVEYDTSNRPHTYAVSAKFHAHTDDPNSRLSFSASTTGGQESIEKINEIIASLRFFTVKIPGKSNINEQNENVPTLNYMRDNFGFH